MTTVTNINQYSKTTYALIRNKADSNTLIQGLTGVVGFPYTLIAINWGNHSGQFGPM